MRWLAVKGLFFFFKERNKTLFQANDLLEKEDENQRVCALSPSTLFPRFLAQKARRRGCNNPVHGQSAAASTAGLDFGFPDRGRIP